MHNSLALQSNLRERNWRKGTFGRELEEGNWRKENWRKGTVGEEVWERIG